jgi:(p)ppGpp synthase/HD superfamily hydrolase
MTGQKIIDRPKGEMLCRMISLATARHAGQFDKGGRPYILHPLTVMQRLRTDDEELQCIAVGHDLVEDTATTSAELRELGFSERIVVGIRDLTKFESQSQAEYRRVVKGNVDAIRVKIEDLRHNSDIRRLKGVTEKDVARMVRYHEFYLELQAALAARHHV